MKNGDLVVPVKHLPDSYNITNQENECVVEVLKMVSAEMFHGRVIKASRIETIGYEDRHLLTKYFVPVKSENFKTLYEKLL